MRHLLPLMVGAVLTTAPASAAPPTASVRPLWITVSAEPVVDYKQSDRQQLCTANSINEKVGLWITAAHCTLLGPVAVEEFHPGKESTYHLAKVIDVDTDGDIAVLLTDYHVTAFKLAEHTPIVWDVVSMVGYPGGLRKAIYLTGSVAAYDVDFKTPFRDYGRKIIFDMTVCGGSSGSAVYNEQGEMVSVMQIGPGDPCSPLSGGVILELLRKFAERYFQ